MTFGFVCDFGGLYVMLGFVCDLGALECDLGALLVTNKGLCK